MVTLYRRDQTPAEDLATEETLVRLARVHADVQSSYLSTIVQTTQIDGPVTHIINIRWRDYPENIQVVTRVTERAPDGTLRGEIFRVRRTKEVGGRKRYLQMECELEHSRTVVDDSDSTMHLLVEPYEATRWDEGTTEWDDGSTVWQEGSAPPAKWDVSPATLSPTTWDDDQTTWEGAP